MTTPGPRFASPAIFVERRRRLRMITGGMAPLLLGAIALLVASPLHTRSALCLSAAALLLGDLAALAGAVSRPLPKARRRGGARGAIEVREGGLSIDRAGRPTLSSGPAREGWIEAERATRVALVLPGGDVVAVELEREEDAERLFAAVGLAADQRVFEIALQSRIAAARLEPLTTLGTLLLIAATLGATAFALSALAHASVPRLALSAGLFGLDGFLWWKLLSAWSTPIAIVGTDGLVVRALGRRAFVDYARVDEVESDSDGVELSMSDGATLRLPLATSAGSGLPARVLRNRIRAAMRGASSAPVSFAALERAGRSVDAWRAALGGLLEREDGYRGAPIEPAALAGLAADASASPERRVAAAVALARAEPLLRRRVRDSAASSADPHLRVALERAIEGEIDEAELEAAEAERAR